MTTERAKEDVLNQEFLPVRARLLEIAAALDRTRRAEGNLDGDPRWDQLCSAVEILRQDKENLAELLQLHFSRPYDKRWRES